MLERVVQNRDLALDRRVGIAAHFHEFIRQLAETAGELLHRAQRVLLAHRRFRRGFQRPEGFLRPLQQFRQAVDRIRIADRIRHSRIGIGVGGRELKAGLLQPRVANEQQIDLAANRRDPHALASTPGHQWVDLHLPPGIAGRRCVGDVLSANIGLPLIGQQPG